MSTAPSSAGKEKINWLNRIALATLIYTVLVIIWGAVVRITGAGAGCGEHWPLCNGAVIPPSFDTHRLIEFSHRASSSLSGLLVIALTAAAFKLTDKGHPARLSAAITVGLIILEGLVGGSQVLLGLTAKSVNPARGFVQGVHLANTFALCGSILMTVFFSYGLPVPKLKGQGIVGILSYLALALSLLLGMLGAVTALGDVLFMPAGGGPVETIKHDYAAYATIIENFRVVHPLLAILSSAFFAWLGVFLRQQRPSREVELCSKILLLTIGCQLILGMFNVALKAPAWLQISHLLMAIALWLAMLSIIYFAFIAPVPSKERRS